MLGEGVRAAFELYGRELRTVCYVEREAAAAAQLARLMEAGALDPCPIWSDLLTFDSAAWRGCVDLLIAGFPCQDISIAGKRAGLDGKRSGLFFNILDIADACGASALVLENVSAIATATATAVDEAEGTLEERAAARVVGELADRGWDAEWITLSASDVGASHGRARWFCLAWRALGHARHDAGRAQHREQPKGSGGRPGKPGAGCDGGDVGDTGLQHQRLQQWADGAEPSAASGKLADAGHGARAHQPISIGGGGGQADDCAGGEAMGGAMAHTRQPGLPHAQQPEPGGPWAGHEGRAAAELCGAPLFAPGPLSPRWAAIVANRPDLVPAVEPGVRMLADGMAYLVDESRAHQLRQVGNGVVPLQAAAAVVELLRRAAGR